MMIEAVEMCGEFKGMDEMFMSIIDSIATFTFKRSGMGKLDI